MDTEEEDRQWARKFLKLVGAGRDFHPAQMQEYVALQTGRVLTEKEKGSLDRVARELGAKDVPKKGSPLLRAPSMVQKRKRVPVQLQMF